MENIAKKQKIDLPAHQSAFLWGPRKSGKSTFLKKSHANLLEGRTWKFELFPFVSAELHNLNLLHGLNNRYVQSIIRL